MAERDPPVSRADEQQTESDHPRAEEQQSHHYFVAIALELIKNADFPEKCGVTLTTFRDNLKRVIDRSLAYVNIFVDFCFFGRDEDRIKAIKDKIQDDDLGELTDFIDQIKTYLEKLPRSYDDVKSATDDFLLTVQNATENCREQEKSENRKKHATRAVGGAATAGLLAAGVGTGVTLSIIAGVFTFGVGTIVGLAATAAGTAVAGAGLAAGTGVATHLAASHFDEEEKKCEQLSKCCSDLQLSASRMDVQIRVLRSDVELISTTLENVQKTKMSHKSRQTLVVTLNHLLKMFMEIDYDTFVELKRELEARNS